MKMTGKKDMQGGHDMSYMRGEYYVFESDDGLNIYTKDGWTLMPMKIFDALVVMRFVEMTETEKQRATKLAIKRYSGNFGADKLRQRCGLETCFDIIKKHFEQKNAKAKVRKNVRG